LAQQAAAGRLGTTALKLTQRGEVADEGVDAEVSQAISPGSDPEGYFDVPTCWQYKASPTGNIKPKKGKGGQEAALRKEGVAVR
jgi:hypothetical protein